MSFTYQKDKQYPSLGKWLLINALGDGATATVFLGYDLTNKTYSAIKLFKESDPVSTAQAKKEALLHSTLQHELIIQMKEFKNSADYIDIAGNKKSVCYMELELAKGGNLYLLLERAEFVPEKLARTYFHHIIEALEHLNQKKITHGDIKLENLILDSNFCIKLSDFGCASRATKQCLSPLIAGSSRYFPPERNAQQAFDGASADIFATGIVLFCLVFGRMPFTRATKTDYFYYLLSNHKEGVFWQAHEEISQKRGNKTELSLEFKELVIGMLDPDPKRRLSIETIKKSGWYQSDVYTPFEVKDLVQRMI